MAASSGALLLLRRKFYICCNLGQGQVSTSTRIHGVAKLSALGLFRRRCCYYSSKSSQSTRHASTFAFDGGLSRQEAEDSVASTVKDRVRKFILGAGASFGAVAFMCRKPWATEGYGWKHAYFTTLARYDLSIQLLSADVRISWRLLLKLCHGKSLSRRERQLLLQTTTDLFITVPAAEYLVVHSMDLLFPVLPSLKGKRKLNARIEVIKFLSDLATNMVDTDGNSRRGDIQPSAEEYFEFVTRVARRRPVKVEEVLGFAKLFTDELILINVSRYWLVNMCKNLGIPPLGTDEFLRFVLQERLEFIKHEDKLIQAKGVDSLSEAELCKVCKERGIQVAEEMRHVAEEMRQELRTWLGLSLRHSLSSSFLIISRVFTVVGNPNINPLEPALLTIDSFSYEFKLIVGVASFQSNDPIKDKTRKLHCLELQEKRIEEEEKKELSEMKQSDASKEDVALQEMTISMPEQARAISMDQQEQPFKLINDAITVLSSALNVCTDCEKITRLVNEEAVALPPNLEKEIADMDSETGSHWQVLDRYCDGKVSLDVVTAATFLKDTLDKDAIQEHLSNLLKYKDKMTQKSVSGSLDTEETLNSETPQLESSSLTTDPKTLDSDSSATDGEAPQSETLQSESASLTTDPKTPESNSSNDRKTPESEFGMDYKHWFVQVKLPDGELSRDEIINFYVRTLASVVGSEEEAKMKIYSVSTIHYYAFGALISEELSSKLKKLPQVLEVDPDCYLNKKNKDYGGEPFENGQAVPYDRKYHASYWKMRNARVDPHKDDDKDAGTKIPQKNQLAMTKYHLYMLKKKWQAEGR